MEFLGPIYEKPLYKVCYFHSPYVVDYHVNCVFLLDTPIPYNVLFVAFISFLACHLVELIMKSISDNLIFPIFIKKQLKLLSEKPENVNKKASEDEILTKEDKIRFYNKIISYLHAWVSTIAAIYVLATEPTTWFDAGHGWTVSFEVVLGISIGYFCFDLLFSLRYVKALGIEVSMIIHHLVCIVGILYCLNFRVGVLYCITLLITEITTPFFQHRWFLSFFHMNDSILFKINGILFWLMFFFCRVVWCFIQNVHIFYLADQYNFSPYFQRFPIIIPSLLFLLNVFWFMIITKIVVRMIKKVLCGIDDKKKSDNTVNHTNVKQEDKAADSK
ncbi:hypothetical protein ABK040_001042 [Willaertia magna]